MSNNYRARPPVPGPACEYFAPLLPLVGQEDLDPRNGSRLRQHLATCGYCQNELKGYTWLDDALARHFGPAPRGPLSPADIRELTSRAYRPRTAPPAPESSRDHRQPRPSAPFRPTHLPPSRRGRRLISILSAIAAVVVIAAVSVAIFKSHIPSQTNHTTPTPATTASASVGTLPAFSDWRVAYVGPNGILHAITQNGATDSSASPALPLIESKSGFHIDSAGVSLDGHFFAYGGNDQIYIANLAAHNASALPIQTIQGVDYGMFWSPDSSRLAISFGQSWSIVGVASQGNQTPVQAPSDASLIGWVDATHLLALTGSGNTNSPQSLLSVDLFTGKQKTIATVSLNGLGWGVFIASPDGKQVLLYTTTPGEGATDTSFTPFVEVIDTATGKKHPLPQIAQQTGAGFPSIAWKSGTETVAVSSVLAASPYTASWVLDLAHDTATKLPGALFPVGWAPDTGALILSDSLDSDATASYTAHKISIISSWSPAPAAPVVLVEVAYQFPFIGFVRTADTSTPITTPTSTAGTAPCTSHSGPTDAPNTPGATVTPVPFASWGTYTSTTYHYQMKYPTNWVLDNLNCPESSYLAFWNYDYYHWQGPGFPPGGVKIELYVLENPNGFSAMQFFQMEQQNQVGGPACPAYTTRALQVDGHDAIEAACPGQNTDLYYIPDGTSIFLMARPCSGSRRQQALTCQPQMC